MRESVSVTSERLQALSATLAIHASGIATRKFFFSLSRKSRTSIRLNTYRIVNKKLSYRRETARRAMLVNSCSVLRII